MNEKQLQLVNFEQANRLDRSGFDWECDRAYHLATHEAEYVQLRNYNSHTGKLLAISAPTVACALKWCRDVKFITYEIEVCRVGTYTCRYVNTRDEFVNANGGKVYNNYEAAESALLDELLNLIEKEK